MQLKSYYLSKIKDFNMDAEKNIFLNEGTLLRVHLPNGNFVLLTCDEDGSAELSFENNKLVLIPKKVKNVRNKD